MAEDILLSEEGAEKIKERVNDDVKNDRIRNGDDAESQAYVAVYVGWITNL